MILLLALLCLVSAQLGADRGLFIHTPAGNTSAGFIAEYEADMVISLDIFIDNGDSTPCAFNENSLLYAKTVPNSCLRQVGINNRNPQCDLDVNNVLCVSENIFVNGSVVITNLTAAWATSSFNCTSGRSVQAFIPNLGTQVDIAFIHDVNRALTRSVSDMLVDYGNCRGDAAVDLQLSRAAPTQVASGQYSVILNGQRNTASNLSSSVVNGDANFVSGQYSTIVNGFASGCTGDYSFISPGDSNSINGGTHNAIVACATCSIGNSIGSAILSGQNSFIQDSTRSTIVGGISHGISGAIESAITHGRFSQCTAATCLSGGTLNIVNGPTSSIHNGVSNTVNGFLSSVANGAISQIQGDFCFIGSGQQNSLGTDADYSAVLVGRNNGINSGSFMVSVTGEFNTVQGGSTHNYIFGVSNAASGSTNFVFGTSNNATSQSQHVVLMGLGLEDAQNVTEFTSFGRYNSAASSPYTSPENRVLTIGAGNSTAARANIFTVTNVGNVRIPMAATYGNSATPASVQYLEHSKGTKLSTGTSVVMDDDGTIRPCTVAADCFGVVTESNAGFVSDTFDEEWQGKWDRQALELGQRVLSREYDSSRQYRARSARDEWHKVAWSGMVEIKKGQVVNPGWRRLPNKVKPQPLDGCEWWFIK